MLRTFLFSGTAIQNRQGQDGCQDRQSDFQVRERQVRQSNGGRWICTLLREDCGMIAIAIIGIIDALFFWAAIKTASDEDDRQGWG